MPVWLIVLICSACLIAFAVVLASVCDRYSYRLNFRQEDTASVFTILGFIIGVLGVVASPIIGCKLEKEYRYVQYENVYSVRGMNDDLDGQFFLGSGYIDEVTYYMVFVEDDKGVKLKKYRYSNTYIVEVDDGHHYVECIKEKWQWDEEYILYVPVGTIIVEYKI